MKNRQYLYILFLLGGLIYGLNGCYKVCKPKSSSVSHNPILSAKLLNSERIKMKYGNYNIKVLNSDSKLRISDLYSLQDGKKTTRTFAVVNYPKTVDDIFLREHTQIVEGHSMGRVFKDHGWEIEKRSIFIGEILPSNDIAKVYALMGNISPSKLAVYIYGFYIRKNDKEFRYATIAEIYHPDYITLNDLGCINNDADKYLEKTPYVIQKLKQIKSEINKL